MEPKDDFDRVVERVEELIHLDQTIQQAEISDEHQQLVKDGEVLIAKCKQLKLQNKFIFWKKPGYTRKLLKLERDVCRLAGVDLNVDTQEDMKKVLEKMKELQRAMLRSLADSASAVPDIPSPTVGFDLLKEELKTMVLQGGKYLVGVCAPGGCGKTTLVANLCRDEDIKGRFQDILFLTVSSAPKFTEIVRRLWVRLVDKNDIPIFSNDEDAVAHLMEKLKQKSPGLDSVLIVLDDVWSESVLKKLNFQEAKIKTIVTSRIKFEQFDSICFVNMLAKDHSRALFNHYAFPPGDVAQRPDEDLVEQIVDRCKGFALALKVLGSSLRNQPPRLWRRTADMLKEEGTQLFDVHKELLNCLAPSVKSLEDDLYECYLDLGCFPEDMKIPASALMDIWIETHGLTEDAAYAALHNFSARSLITLHERYGTTKLDRNVQNLYVIQHTFLRDLAIYFNQHDGDSNSSKRLIFNHGEGTPRKNWSHLKEQAPLARIISLHTGEMAPHSWPDVSFPQCEALIVHFSAKNYCIPPFVGKMEKLKVLIVTNYSSSHAEISCSSLPGNLRRLRLEKIFIPVLPVPEVPLGSLYKLTLTSCRVRGADKTSNYFASFPSLVELEIDYCLDLVELSDGISCLTNLEKLSVRNCPDLTELPGTLGELANVTELKLQACIGLERLPNSICKLQKLKVLDVSYCSIIEEFPEDFGKLSILETLDARSCSEIQELPESIKKMLNLKTVICDEETADLWRDISRTLSKLEVSVVKENLNLNWLG